MSAGIWNITAEQGATFSPTLIYKDSDGVPVEMTGWQARMQIRKTYGAATAQVELTTENGGITLGAAGQIALLISAADMAALPAADVQTSSQRPPSRDYVYDLELIVGDVVSRLLEGKFRVSRGVTR